MATRFFTIDMFTCLTSHNGCRCMPMVRSRHQYGIDIFIFQYLTNILFRLRIASNFLYGSNPFCQCFFFHIANVTHFHILTTLEITSHTGTTAIGSHNGHIHSFVRTHNIRITLGTGRFERHTADGQTHTRCGDLFDKASSCCCIFHVSVCFLIISTF